LGVSQSLAASTSVFVQEFVFTSFGGFALLAVAFFHFVFKAVDFFEFGLEDLELVFGEPHLGTTFDALVFDLLVFNLFHAFLFNQFLFALLLLARLDDFLLLLLLRLDLLERLDHFLLFTLEFVDAVDEGLLLQLLLLLLELEFGHLFLVVLLLFGLRHLFFGDHPEDEFVVFRVVRVFRFLIG